MTVVRTLKKVCGCVQMIVGRREGEYESMVVQQAEW